MSEINKWKLPKTRTDLPEEIPFSDPLQLLNSFYKYLLIKYKKSTAKDYTARVKTFADKYLQTIPRMWESYRNHGGDTILFTYKYLELIIASFETKNEAGETNKQRNNIRSALRKLNEFKQSIENKQ